jgi:hypothetical protein
LVVLSSQSSVLIPIAAKPARKPRRPRSVRSNKPDVHTRSHPMCCHLCSFVFFVFFVVCLVFAVWKSDWY